ncbi:hypothetical protein [Chitinophaga sp.]|uniref:hypothetical protein n=1 Tax=Chitinophaga sp. TaxID=1869181 RepID=UPI002F9520AD
MFTTEAEMSVCFEKYLKKTFGNTYFKEYGGLFGIPDFVLYSKQNQQTTIVSFELKLKNWKRAALQAFRYRSFSNLCYVVMDEKSKHAASKNIELFKQYNIGLATFTPNNGLQIFFMPESKPPFSTTQSQKILNAIPSGRRSAKSMELICA